MELTKEFQQADIGRRSAIDHEIVDDLKLLCGFGGEAKHFLVALGIGSVHAAALDGVPAAAGEVAHVNLAGLSASDSSPAGRCRLHRAVDGAREAHAEVDADAILKNALKGLLVVEVVKVGQEAERAERKRNDWGHDALKEPGRKEHGAVAAELEDGGSHRGVRMQH